MNIRHLYKLANKYDAEYVDAEICVIDKDRNLIFSGKLEYNMVGIMYDEELDNDKVVINIVMPEK